MKYQKKKNGQKQKQAAALKTPAQKYLSHYLVVENKDSSDVFNDINNLAIGNATIHTDLDYDLSIINVENPGTGEAAPAPEPPIINTNAVVDDPDFQATYPGGNKELVRFLERNLQSPEDKIGRAHV